MEQPPLRYESYRSCSENCSEWPFRSPGFSRSFYTISISGWWFGTFFMFPYIGNFNIPTDYIIFFFGGVGQPPTSLAFPDLSILFLLVVRLGPLVSKGLELEDLWRCEAFHSTGEMFRRCGVNLTLLGGSSHGS